MIETHVMTPEEFISVDEAVGLFGEDFLPKHGVVFLRNEDDTPCGCLAGACGYRKGGLNDTDTLLLETWFQPQGKINPILASRLAYGFDDGLLGRVESVGYKDDAWYQHGYEIGTKVKEKFNYE